MLNTLISQQHVFLQPTSGLNATVVHLGKKFLDPLARDICDAQSVRQKYKRPRKKRKLTEYENEPHGLLRVQQLYTDGFGVEQVWQQTRRILDATAAEMQREMMRRPIGVTDDTTCNADGRTRAVQFQELRNDEAASDDSLGDEGVDWEYEGNDVGTQESELNGELQDRDKDSNEEREPVSGYNKPLSETLGVNEHQETLQKDKHGLNDGFFSIDQFNKTTQLLENVDSRGDNDDGAASDEEEVDWAADPLMQETKIQTRTPRRQRTTQTRDEDLDEENSHGEDGPTFGDADLNAPDSDEDELDENEVGDSDIRGDLSNTNDIMYDEFFAPPARSKRRGNMEEQSKPHRNAPITGKALKSQILATEDEDLEDEDDAQIQWAISSLQNDLLEDEDEDLRSQSDEKSNTNNQQQNLSSHERRMIEFKKEISRLESENVASKPWALRGETVAPARPENALLEEDLDFERAGKPLPVITQEVNESIEELIKRRVLNNEFDEVARRRPELEGLNGPTRRGILDAHGRREELSDTKPQRGLAEEYEEEYLRNNDPNYVEQRSEATKKKHAEIEKQWAELRAQLDALSNWHYKPRPPERNLEVRTDAPTVQMEDVRPAAEGGVGASGLAPQEVYKPGKDGKTAGEIRTKGGTAVSKEEETRESKRARRRRNKEKAHKARDNAAPVATAVEKPNSDAEKGKAQKRRERDEVVKTLKQGNVKLIGKKGELQDVEGKAATTNAHGGRSGVAGYML